MIIVLIIAALLVTPFVVGLALSGPRYKGAKSPHFDGVRFINPGGVKAKGFSDVMKWMITRKQTPWRAAPFERGKRPLSHYNDGFRITLVNHTTFLIQVDGLNILTDPVWSERVSPFSWIGPKRQRPPGILFEDLPKIDLVLLSHNHYDHLDLPTLRLVQGAHHPEIITALGISAFLKKEHVGKAVDMDWWEKKEFGRIAIHCVPAQHFSGRGLLDRDATLWCGFVLTTRFGRLYFAGDTGYNETTFKEIGNRLGPMNVSLLPIGAYKPEWFMATVHTSPDGAVRIHRDVKSELSIGSHFGTFPLADEGRDDPATDLAAALTLNGVAPDSFIVPKEGEAIVVE